MRQGVDEGQDKNKSMKQWTTGGTPMALPLICTDLTLQKPKAASVPIWRVGVEWLPNVTQRITLTDWKLERRWGICEMGWWPVLSQVCLVGERLRCLN